MKIDLPGDDWDLVVSAALEVARAKQSAHLMRLAARILRQQGLSATAGAIEADAERFEASPTESR